MNRTFISIITAACIIIYFSNCNKTTSASPSVLRIFNVDPTLQSQDMFLNGGAPQVTGLSYGDNTKSVPILPGTYNIKLAPTGTTTFSADYNIDFSAGKNYMMFLLNVNGAIQPEVFDENIQRLGVDTAEFRFLTFSPNAPLMNVAIKSDTAKFDTTYTIFTNRHFNDAYANRQYAQFTRITSGPYNLKLQYLVVDSTAVNFYRAVTFDSIPVQFDPGKSYSVYTRGYFDSSGGAPFKIDTLINK